MPRWVVCGRPVSRVLAEAATPCSSGEPMPGQVWSVRYGGDVSNLQDDLLLLDDVSEERLLALAAALQRGDSWALWTGAGLSTAAGLPNWATLVREAAAEFGVAIPANDREIESNAYPALLAECVERAPSEGAFWSFVAARLCGGTPAPVHGLVASLPFELFLTTNYDCLLEPAHALREGPDPRVVAYPDLNVRFVNGGRLIYLHGRCMCDGAGDPLSEDRVVLTERSYQEAYAERRSTLSALLQLILADFSVLFVGASLSDWQQWQLMETARQLRSAAEARPGGRPGRDHYAITKAPTSAVGAAADQTFKGTRFGIRPIFYRPDPSGGHGAVELIARWLSSTVVRPSSAFEVVR
jgi:hypothetical protein